MVEKWLYNISVRTYAGGVAAAAPFYKKAKLLYKGRQQTFRKIKNFRAQYPDKLLVWYHCASLGEFEQARPLLEARRLLHPNELILLSFFSPSGYEVRQQYEHADCVCYLPADSKAHARKIIKLARPSLVFFIKYEFWYHYLKELHKQQIPTYLVSAIFLPEQPFFQSYGPLFRKMLHFYTGIFVQNEGSAFLLKGISTHLPVTVAGDTRFDRVATIAQNTKTLPVVSAFCQDTFTLVVGSAWPADTDLLHKAIETCSSDIKVIIAPHNIKEEYIKDLQDQFEQTITYSKAESTNPKQLASYRILIIDNIGLLSSLYKYGHAAWIGGGLATGLHNTAEAAVFGLPIAFGNQKYQKFREACDMLLLGCAFATDSPEEALDWLKNLVRNQKERAEQSEIARKYVEDQTGATQIILDTIAQ